MAEMKDRVAESMAGAIQGTKAVVPATKFDTFKNLLERSKGQIAAALPKHMSAERIIRVARTALSRNPKLLECETTTVISAIIQSSQLGLEPDGALGHGYLVPFKNNKTGKLECQFIPGYRGFADLAFRSGKLILIHMDAVRTGDVFEFEYGSNGHLKHIPGENRGEITHFYCFTKYTNGGEGYTVITKAEAEHTKARSRAGTFGPWVTDFEAMGCKTAVRRHAKLMPMSIELADAIDHDTRVEFGGVEADLITETPQAALPAPPQSPEPTPEKKRGRPAAKEASPPESEQAPEQSPANEPGDAFEGEIPGEKEINEFDGKIDAAQTRAQMDRINMDLVTSNLSTAQKSAIMDRAEEKRKIIDEKSPRA